MQALQRKNINRRDFLKISAASVSGLALAGLRKPFDLPITSALPDFPKGDQLGRACHGTLDIYARPSTDSQKVGFLYEDGVAPWLREVVGESTSVVFSNQRWVEIPDGFVYAPNFQPVKNLPNQPLANLPQSSLGPGFWAEVTVPYVDAVPENEPSEYSWVKAKLDEGLPVRLYYSQIFWVDRIRNNNAGQVFYRVNPNYYGGIDMLWAAAEAFRPITAEEIAPIHPEVENKRIEVDVTHQTMSCYEGDQEIYFCRVSTGAKFDMYGNAVDKWGTPLGEHIVTRKYVSLQMSGGTTGAGYDLPGIGWTSIFATGGVAVHSTFWHNNYGDPMSHGCVNVSPQDAKWVFRWTAPVVSLDPGMVDITVTHQSSTRVKVIEA
jgi:lipoprotein-anchoring transpeptidase ErfK/SrfK